MGTKFPVLNYPSEYPFKNRLSRHESPNSGQSGIEGGGEETTYNHSKNIEPFFAQYIHI